MGFTGTTIHVVAGNDPTVHDLVHRWASQVFAPGSAVVSDPAETIVSVYPNERVGPPDLGTLSSLLAGRPAVGCFTFDSDVTSVGLWIDGSQTSEVIFGLAALQDLDPDAPSDAVVNGAGWQVLHPDLTEDVVASLAEQDDRVFSERGAASLLEPAGVTLAMVAAKVDLFDGTTPGYTDWTGRTSITP